MEQKENDELIKKRFAELARKCYEKGIYTNTSFLNMLEIDIFLKQQRDLSFVPYTLEGGYEAAERKVLRFGDEDTLGYAEELPIKRLVISPLMEKFADDLGHRDFLGSLMNLGIDRSLIGDIVLYEKGSRADVYVMASMADFICSELTRIRHTSVKCEIADSLEGDASHVELTERIVSVSSERADVIICKVYNISRTIANELFAAGRVFINSRLTTSNSVNLKAGDVVSVRGHGRFTFCGTEYVNKKGKSCVKIVV